MDEAVMSFREAAEGGARGAQAWLGVQCTVDGNTDGARGWFDRVLSATQEPGAGAGAIARAFDLRDLLPEAVHWARKAVEEGGRYSDQLLAEVLKQSGEKFEAEEVLHRAHTAGEPFTANDLGVLVERRGATAEAEAYYREAARGGDPWGKYNLSLNLRRRGENAAADRFMREAADNGQPSAAAKLAEEGELAPESRRLYLERASHLGVTEAMLDLSRLFQELPDDFGESDHWCRRAAEQGLPAAVMEMAERAKADDCPDDAESWLRTAALEHHKLRAMYLLADLEEARGAPAEAEAWRRRARIREPGPVSAVVSAADT